MISFNGYCIDTNVELIIAFIIGMYCRNFVMDYVHLAHTMVRYGRMLVSHWWFKRCQHRMIVRSLLRNS